MIGSLSGGLGAIIWFLIAFVVPLAALISAATTPSANFKRANSSKVLWVIMPLLLGFVAACIYFFYIQPRLKRATRL
jgi:predicted MFS family arabinose efflux permease